MASIDPLESLRYPIGRPPRQATPLDASTRAQYLAMLADAPSVYRALSAGLGDSDLDRAYRPGGWTLRQVFHHVPDSHMNAYVRMKLAATEDQPQVRTYDEARWAELVEAKTGPIEMSLVLLEALHHRWGAFLTAMPPADWRRAFQHPDWGAVTLDECLVLYAWHCRHHAAHIANALKAS